jgi:hypothetical protein
MTTGVDRIRNNGRKRRARRRTSESSEVSLASLYCILVHRPKKSEELQGSSQNVPMEVELTNVQLADCGGRGRQYQDASKEQWVSGSILEYIVKVLGPKVPYSSCDGAAYICAERKRKKGRDIKHGSPGFPSLFKDANHVLSMSRLLLSVRQGPFVLPRY